MTTLREAAQQALEALEKVGLRADARRGCDEAVGILRAALAQEQDEPVEPVAWIESPHGAIRANPNYKFTFPSQLLHWQIPLYTAPPQRKPLTEEEIDALPWNGSPRQFARAVEKAVWEKNHGQA